MSEDQRYTPLRYDQSGLRGKRARVLVDEGPLYQDPHLVVGGVGDSGLAGARPKIEQFVWARRTHRARGV